MRAPLRIAAIEPYAAVSHASFLKQLARASRHDVELLTLPARHWKWRMRTSAVHFAREVRERGPFDGYFVSDYLNLAEFLALLPPELACKPAWTYFHENQLTYPLQDGEARDVHFAMTHYYSVLTSRRSLFNSDYHRTSFFDALEELAAGASDVDLCTDLAAARARADVVPLGTDLARGTPRPLRAGAAPVILWNHRWEYDKDPERFVDALVELDRRGRDFEVRLLGQRFRSMPPAYARVVEALGERIVGDGFCADGAAYRAALDGAHIVASTARHEFFGLGTLEALRAGLYPVLPNALAYPELLPASAHGLLYDPDGDVTDALEAALDALAVCGESPGWRTALVEHTDRFSWSNVASSFDAVFADDAANSTRRPT